MRIPETLLALLVAVTVAYAVTGCGADTTDEPPDEQEEAAPAEETPVGEDSDEEAETETQADEAAPFTIGSSAYEDGDDIPLTYVRGTIGGGDLSPPLAWSGAPDGTQSFAIVMVDRHPVANEWIHWMVVGIPASVEELPEGASASAMPSGSRELDNTWGEPGYGGPQPPADTGDHDYEITIYALDVDSLDLAQDASFTDFLTAVRDRMLGAATFMGVVTG